ncbi:MAG: hypothetical protein LKM30_02955 [Bacilli bacterium]|jgi:uncharacterized paraquat-inducible protein A|nr:hypothetical protein [Bacilli bacterium]
MTNDSRISFCDSLKKKENLPFFFAALLAVVLLLSNLFPFVSTESLGTTSYLSGYQSLTFLSDQQDSLYVASVMFLFSLVLTGLLVLGVLVPFFLKDEKTILRMRILAGTFCLGKIVLDCLFLYFVSNTKTNVRLAWGSYVSVALTAIGLIGYCLLSYFLLRTKKKD